MSLHNNYNNHENVFEVYKMYEWVYVDRQLEQSLFKSAKEE